jgi:hypothetical protein
MTEAAMRSSGRVENPETYNYRTFLPERRGLYCEDIFGPVPWKAGEQRMAEDQRRERWAHVELPFDVARGVGSGARLWVVPPAYRRFSLLTPEAHRALARARRAELLALAAGDDWPYSDPLEKLLAEEGLADAAELELLEEGSVESRLNTAYRGVINISSRYRRLAELNAPQAVLESEEALVRQAVLRLDVELRSAQVPQEISALALTPAEP